MRWLHLLAWAVVFTLLLAFSAEAKVVISEVMWMGTDLGSSDEWVELTGIGESLAGSGARMGSGSSAVTNLNGWTLSRLNSSGLEVPIIRFGSGDHLGSGEILVVSHLAPESSRLGSPPLFAVAAEMVLPNTKLLLWLRDASGAIVDVADDGVGNPFAGANSTGEGAIRASMERTDLTGSGGVSANWRTATTWIGWDDGALLRGTPGFRNGTGWTLDLSPPLEALNMSGTFLQIASGGLIVVRWIPSASLDLANQRLSVAPALLTGTGSVLLAKTVSGATLSGALLGSGYSVTLQSADESGNVSLGAEIEFEPYLKSESSISEQTSSSSSASSLRSSSTGTVLSVLSSSSSSSSFGTGSSTLSCMSSQCDTTVIQNASFSSSGSGTSSSSSASGASSPLPQPPPPPSASRLIRTSSSSSAACVPSTLRTLKISEFFPRPVGNDAIEEWIELRNDGDEDLDLCGWRLDDSDGGSRAFAMDWLSVRAHSYLLLPRPVTGIALNDAGDRVRIFVGSELVDEIGYESAHSGLSFAREGTAFHWTLDPTPGAENRIREPQGRLVSSARESQPFMIQVVHIVDGDTFDALTVSGSLVRVRLIGVDAPELGSTQPLLEANASRAKDMLQSLMLNKIIELQFDSDKTDSYGRMLAYPLLPDGRAVQGELLREGLAAVATKFSFARRDEFLGYESLAKLEGRGIWATGVSRAIALAGSGSQIGDGGPAEDREEPFALEVLLSEVYPSPQSGTGILSLLRQEWIELFNPTERAVDLSGWTLDDAKGKGSKPWMFPLGFLLDAFSFKVITAQESGLKLNNDGDEVWLSSPDGSISDRLEFGRIDQGSALARVDPGEEDSETCETATPTPGAENVCDKTMQTANPVPAIAAKIRKTPTKAAKPTSAKSKAKSTTKSASASSKKTSTGRGGSGSNARDLAASLIRLDPPVAERGPLGPISTASIIGSTATATAGFWLWRRKKWVFPFQ